VYAGRPFPSARLFVSRFVARTGFMLLGEMQLQLKVRRVQFARRP
jgi:hypothetical protein